MITEQGKRERESPSGFSVELMSGYILESEGFQDVSIYKKLGNGKKEYFGLIGFHDEHLCIISGEKGLKIEALGNKDVKFYRNKVE
jgi:hypothetical protein